MLKIPLTITAERAQIRDHPTSSSDLPCDRRVLCFPGTKKNAPQICRQHGRARQTRFPSEINTVQISKAMRTHVKNPSSTFNPAGSSPGLLLQRKCACGGTPGPTGE